MTLTDLADVQQQAIQQLAAAQIGPSFSARYIGGGRNSRVYHLVSDDGQACAAKVYFRQAGDPRDRLGTEFAALSFLWRNDVRNIPRPLACCAEDGVALYEFIEGEKIPAEALTIVEIDAAVNFVARLQKLTTHPEASTLNPASEAYFSIARTYQNIQSRLARFTDPQQEQDLEPALREFLDGDFLPSLEKITRWSRSQADWDQELAPILRTLSPSDFGFHNAIRRDDIVFLDFEYFGWDDPAKLISDFILHPAMSLNNDLARRFASAVVQQFDADLKQRIRSVYPLFGLKWCLICLNEFLPDHRARRQFAGASTQDWSSVRAQQLAKAQRMLARINEDYEHFPYFD